MKIRLIILTTIISLLVLCIASCRPYHEPVTYKFLPQGDITITNLDSRFLTLKDSVLGPFDINIHLKTEQLFSINWNIIPEAMAYSPAEPNYTNEINWEKSSIIINKPFVYKDRIVTNKSNLMLIEPHLQLTNNYLYGYHRVIIDEKFLYYAKFNKGWTTFTISGELQDGQKFEFEKEVYLDL